VPLVALLGLQYLWLERLERASADAHRATLDNLLEAVAAGVEVHYRSLGERVLNLPASIFTPERFGKAPYYFKKKETTGVERFFVVSYSGEKGGWPIYYAPGSLEPVAPRAEEERAVYMAIAPWKILASRAGRSTSRPAGRGARPAHRLILNPITDDAARSSAAGLSSTRRTSRRSSSRAPCATRCRASRGMRERCRWSPDATAADASCASIPPPARPLGARRKPRAI
jgi:hypothetical protein